MGPLNATFGFLSGSCCFYAPDILNVRGVDLVFPLYLHTYVRPFRPIWRFPFMIIVLDSYDTHRYIIIQYRSGSILGKIHPIPHNFASSAPFSTYFFL